MWPRSAGLGLGWVAFKGESLISPSEDNQSRLWSSLLSSFRPVSWKTSVRPPSLASHWSSRTKRWSLTDHFMSLISSLWHPEKQHIVGDVLNHKQPESIRTPVSSLVQPCLNLFDCCFLFCSCCIYFITFSLQIHYKTAKKHFILRVKKLFLDWVYLKELCFDAAVSASVESLNFFYFFL